MDVIIEDRGLELPSSLASSSPLLPASFDPAIHLHSDPGSAPTHIHHSSDDVEALQLQRQELLMIKTSQGVVIQHRAWGLDEVFRSDADHPIQSPTKTREGYIKRLGSSTSPVQDKMALISSPVAYPPSSSPVPMRKKRKLAGEGIERSMGRKKLRGGFVEDDSDDDATIVGKLGVTLHETAHVAREAPVAGLILTSTGDGNRGSSTTRLPSTSRSSLSSEASKARYTIRTTSGSSFAVSNAASTMVTPFEQLIAARSATIAGRAKKSYYGVDIHKLLDEVAASNDTVTSQIQPTSTDHLPPDTRASKPRRTQLWTEKYRPRRYPDLCGDERTHRSVLRWLKSWEPIVFPSSRPKSSFKSVPSSGGYHPDGNASERVDAHRKILLLTGPPGLGKTTLAHVLARQAGYEPMEINASDDRSSSVVRGRLRDIVSTENVRGIASTTNTGSSQRHAGKPVCVIVDEVDGVVTGSSTGGSGGEGGFIRALLDLVLLDAKNANASGVKRSQKKKGDDFRLRRPLILICNDVYAPALRPLRQSPHAEVIHLRKAALNTVVTRLSSIFSMEKITADKDAVRQICETAWGISSSRRGDAPRASGGGGGGDGDIRSVLVLAEWAARRLRSSDGGSSGGCVERLTKSWVEKHLTNSSCSLSGAARGGDTRDVVMRVFLENAGFPASLISSAPTVIVPVTDVTTAQRPGTNVGVAEVRKRVAMERLREMIDTLGGESDRMVADCFQQWPTVPFQDDTLLSKPNAGAEWMAFHDDVSGRVFRGGEWEMGRYLSIGALGMHDLFACPASASRAANPWGTNGKRWKGDSEEKAEEPGPFAGPRADYEAREAEKHNRASLSEVQSRLSPELSRAFRSVEDMATELLPWLVKILTPDVKPVIVGGSGDQRGVASVRRKTERDMVDRAVRTMSGVGVQFEKGRLEDDQNQLSQATWVYRMTPPLDILSSFPTATSAPTTSNINIPTNPVRYAVRQVMTQELEKEHLRKEALAREKRYLAGSTDKNNQTIPKATHSSLARPSTTAIATLPTTNLDFFGRVIPPNDAPSDRSTTTTTTPLRRDGRRPERGPPTTDARSENKVWITFHEGFSNAVRKSITLAELMAGL